MVKKFFHRRSPERGSEAAICPSNFVRISISARSGPKQYSHVIPRDVSRERGSMILKLYSPARPGRQGAILGASASAERRLLVGGIPTFPTLGHLALGLG